jgi:hypothetical protein
MTSMAAPLSRAFTAFIAAVFDILAVIYTFAGLILLQSIRLAVWLMQPLLTILGLRWAAAVAPAAVVLATH